MKKFIYVLLTALVLMTAACSSNNDEQPAEDQNESNSEESENDTGEKEAEQADKGESSELTSGIDGVLASLDELKTLTSESPEDTKKIKKTGEAVGENWDEIEEQVEEKYPEDYEYIEESLYPLKAEAKKDDLDMEKIKQLTEDTEKKVKEFKEKLSSDTSMSGEAKDSLQLLEDEEVGSYLADADGMTLYYFKKDEPGKSNCSDDCLDNWPAFVAEEFDVPEGFNQEDFDTIKREDTGEMQVTYKGYPLYYFVKDEAKGDVNGEGVKDVWYIVNAETDF